MNEPFTLSGKSIVITGASMGIGESAAQFCLQAGARVLLCARGRDTLREAANRLRDEGFGDAVTSVVADVSDEGEVARLFQEAQRHFGRVDGLIHAAAVLGAAANVIDADPAGWLDTVRIDLFGTFLVVREACRAMRETGGRIVLFSGGGASQPYPDHTPYACSKVAVVRFAETVAQEMRSYDIEINCVAPGLVATRMTANMDTSRAVPREYGGRAAAFLVSDAARGINGKMISAVHDGYERWPERLDALQTTDIFTLRRILPKERGMDWQ
jgi:NAD(P)-dependent dehydrogenase (short-subunit alcohol dehydrogenase family)